MVVTTILDYFLNNMLISSFSFLKFKILYPYNIYKIIQVFILLSDLHAFISNVIFEGERSFNPPSTPSRLIFDHSLSSFHHHLGPPHHKSPATTPNNPTASPSPLLRDVGSPTNATAPSEARMQPQPPLPFPKGCGRLRFARRRKCGRRKARGDSGSGRPRWCVTKTSDDFGRCSFSFISLPNPLTLNPQPQPRSPTNRTRRRR